MSTWVIERTVNYLEVAQATSEISFKLPDERSETEQMSMEIYTSFLGASEIPSLLEYFRATTEAVNFSIGDIKIYNEEFDPGSG